MVRAVVHEYGRSQEVLLPDEGDAQVSTEEMMSDQNSVTCSVSQLCNRVDNRALG